MLLPMWRSEILKLVLIAEKIKFIKAKRFKSPPHRVFFPNTKIGSKLEKPGAGDAST